MSEPNLAKRIPQVSYRARAYKLEDNGASDLAQRKRALKDSIANSHRAIAGIRDRQNRISVLPPMDQNNAGYLIAKHHDHIRSCEEKIAELRPVSTLVAPVTRRVAREDRRRKRKAIRAAGTTLKETP